MPLRVEHHAVSDFLEEIAREEVGVLLLRLVVFDDNAVGEELADLRRNRTRLLRIFGEDLHRE